MRKPIALILQQETSVPGRVGDHLQRMDRETVIVRPLQGDALPDPAAISGAVVYGGPMSANDDHLDGIRAELAWIPRVLAGSVPFLGICLGAQLLTRALGGTVARHPNGLSEIGFSTVTPTAAANGFLDGPHRFYQWHSEGFTIPSGATVLATGTTFPNQAYRVSPKAIALQFHPEVTDAMMTFWMEDAAEQLDFPGAQPPDVQKRYADDWTPRIDAWTGRFLKRLFIDP